MLIRESQRLDLQELWPTQQAVDENAQSVCGQFGVEPGTQAPEGMGVIDLNLEQLRKLMVDGFDHLTNAIQKSALFSGHLYFLIAAWQSHQPDAVVSEELGGFFSTDVSFITQNTQVSMFAKHFKAHFQVVDVGRRQFEIEDQPAHCDEQVQLEAEDRLLFRRHFAVCGFKSSPITCRAGHKIELNDWQGQAINHTLPILSYIQAFQDRFADQVEGVHQVSPTTIETALRWDVRKQIAVFSPLTQHFRFQVPAATFANQSHAQQLTVAA